DLQHPLRFLEDRRTIFPEVGLAGRTGPCDLTDSASGAKFHLMAPRILLVNPPICDFSAYDYWLKPYGLLRVAGMLRGRAELRLFDYLDRLHPSIRERLRSDAWGRGEFPSQVVPMPEIFTPIRRHYRRFGLPRNQFR